ncbi:MAG: chitobiase/beta-hexosaminidase C-terminal domain-containing protein [Armatimonadetes bacterium]|nr:chitobiase/beta-hexosaminidase C-terminal domain-containing protein [Armatimonadota bacterium]
MKRIAISAFCVCVLFILCSAAAAQSHAVYGKFVVIDCAVEGALIHYTTDGTDPTPACPVYTGPFIIGHDTAISARAWAQGTALAREECVVTAQDVTFEDYLRLTSDSDGAASSGGVRTLSTTIIYVKPDGNDNNNGLSWGYAKQTITAGLNAASAGDEVWVAGATYNEQITLKAGVGLYGGLAYGATSREDRDFELDETIIDAQNPGGDYGSVVTVPTGAGNDTIIDGFTITGGTGTKYYTYWYGGGIYCRRADPTIRNNKIINNSANIGAGISCYGSSPIIERNTIVNNTGVQAGGAVGVHQDGVYGRAASPTIRLNEIRDNTASNGGCAILQNTPEYGSPWPVLVNNWIDGNGRTTWMHGAIYVNYSSASIISNTVTNNNVNPGYNFGGGLSITGSSIYAVDVYNNIFASNDACGVWEPDGAVVTETLKNNDSWDNAGGNYVNVTQTERT